MKIKKLVLLVSSIALAALVHAQPGGGMNSSMFGGSMGKLFGDNPGFSADVEIQMAAGAQNMSVPAKISYDSGKSRFEMSLSEAKGSQLPPGTIEHAKAMGVDKTVMISQPDTKTSYLVYPGLSAYAPIPFQDPAAAKPLSSFKMETTELGKETVGGHPSVKNKVVVTSDQGKSDEFTVWNATDLNKFPVKIEMAEQGHTVTMLFQNVKASKPDAALFAPPAGYTKYDSPQDLIQQEMMKRMGNAPGGHP